MPSATVLLITSRPALADQLGALLGDLGHEAPIIAAYADQAREIMRLVRCDLVLVDTDLAGAAGFNAGSLLEAVDAPPIFFLIDLPSAGERWRYSAHRHCLVVPLSAGALDGALRQARAEAELEAAAARPGAQRGSIELVVAEIAHDLNNLLTRTLGYAELAVESTPDDSETRELVELALGSAHQAREITLAILAQVGLQQAPAGLVHVSDLAREVGGLLRRALGEGRELRFRLREGLPLVYGNAVELRQVLLNLLTNAAEAIRGDAGAITISTSAAHVTPQILDSCQVGAFAPPGPYLRLAVRDTGVGVDAATSMRMFDPFYTTRADGRGLGLASAARIVIDHGGAIRVRSAPGRGTFVAVYLPAAPGAGRGI